jgi:hypothetical protein
MERDRTDTLALGRRLADSVGFRVIALDGREIGLLEHVRYREHTEHPDEIVVRRRRLLWARQGVVPFDEVSAVDPVAQRVYLAVRAASVRQSSWGWAGQDSILGPPHSRGP